MKQIIVISGKQYSGKDTLAKIILSKTKGFKRVGIGDAIKIEYAEKNNLTFDEIEKNKHLYRSDLIELGNEGRAQSPTYWLEKLAQTDKIIVPDIRVKDEAEFFRNENAFLVRINSNYYNRSQRGVITNANDDTETDLDDYAHWNIVIENNSDYLELDKNADKVLFEFKKFLENASRNV